LQRNMRFICNAKTTLTYTKHFVKFKNAIIGLNTVKGQINFMVPSNPNFYTIKRNKKNKPVGDAWIAAPSRNFVAIATRVGPATFCMVPLNRPSP